MLDRTPLLRHIEILEAVQPSRVSGRPRNPCARGPRSLRGLPACGAEIRQRKLELHLVERRAFRLQQVVGELERRGQILLARRQARELVVHLFLVVVQLARDGLARFANQGAIAERFAHALERERDEDTHGNLTRWRKKSLHEAIGPCGDEYPRTLLGWLRRTADSLRQFVDASRQQPAQAREARVLLEVGAGVTERPRGMY